MSDIKQPVIADPRKNVLGEFLKDLVKLRLPVTAGSVVATVVGVLGVAGVVHLPEGATAIASGALVGIGTVAYYVQSLIARARK